MLGDAAEDEGEAAAAAAAQALRDAVATGLPGEGLQAGGGEQRREGKGMLAKMRRARAMVLTVQRGLRDAVDLVR